MRRLLLPLLLAVLLILAACGNASGPSSTNGGSGSQQGLTAGNAYNPCPSHPNTTAAPPESGSITLTVAGFTTSLAEDALVQQNLNQFTQTHPNIHINWMPIAGDYAAMMKARVASGNVPDVFYLPPGLSSQYISANTLLNLSPYMARDNVPATDYYAVLLNPFTCKSGQVYGLPKDWTTLGVYYNKQMFQAAGLPAPDANWTWSAMQNDAQKLTKAPGTPASVYGITLDSNASRWGPFLFANGGTILNPDGTQAAVNSQAAVQALQFYSSFQLNNTGTLPGNVASGFDGDAFGRERAAMALEYGSLIPYLSQNYPNVQYGISPLPLAPTGKSADLIDTTAWAAYAGTTHPDAAWQLIKYMTGSAVQMSQLHAGFSLPTPKSLANDPYFTQHPDIKVLYDAITNGYADYFGPQDAIIHTYLDNAIEKVLLNKADAQTALNEATAQINNQLQAP